MFVRVSYSVILLIWKVFLRMFSEGMWVEPLTLAIMTIRGETFHPLVLISQRKGVIFVNFMENAFFKESLVCVCEFDKLYSISWI